jgi:succinate dehydrogenase/fumarate reductase flavoprotein subunit
MEDRLTQNATCDVLVVGSGAGGLATAITCAHAGLNVIVIEKDKFFGGTTAFSGGVLWIPGNHYGKAQGANDSIEDARTYMKAETGNFYDSDAVDAFLENGPKAVDFFEQETEVKFAPTLYPDYHPDVAGGKEIGRSILAAPFDTSKLGKDLKRLRPPLASITFMGMMFNSSNADIKHFFNATKSVKSFFYVAKRLTSHFLEIARYGRGVQVTSGNALAARLAKSAFDLGVPIYTETPALELLSTDGTITGARVSGTNGPVTITASRGVVIATGGFAQDGKRTGEAYPHLKRGGEHFTPVPDVITGDGITLAENAGGKFEVKYPNTSAWMPVSKVPWKGGEFKAFPHLLDRYKPGIIAVGRNGKRFGNESNSYHDVGEAMIEACKNDSATEVWLICDQPTIRKYGLGFAKPAPVPLAGSLKNGYVQKGATLETLAQVVGLDADALVETVKTYNSTAKFGKDPEFSRGSTAFNRFLGDPAHQPNPNVGPIEKGPFYALRLVMGDLGTFDGLSTSVEGQVIDASGQPIDGLFAVGNDRASIMGGNYPGAGITLGPALTFGYVTGKHIAGTQN